MSTLITASGADPLAIHETVERTAAGAIIFDASVMPAVTEKTFTAAGWKTVRPVEDVLRSGGRGNTLILGDGRREFVLRHYRRGGLPGRFIRDSYFWTGEDRTRPFAEWRVLQKLANLGLRVPRPAVARYLRRGPFFYSADIITVRVPGIRSLSARLSEGAGDEALWRRIGNGLCTFHEAGVNHADLNAHNVQVDEEGEVWLLDFDSAQDPGLNYTESNWEALLEAYFQASRSA